MPGDPVTIADVISASIDGATTRVHTSMPGQVVRYDAVAQTVDVQPSLKQVLFDALGTKVYESYPLLPAVPVAFPSGGSFCITFPLQPGDHVVLLFAEGAMAEWLASGKESEPWDVRRHHISNAIAIPCIRPDTQPLSNTDTSARQAGIVLGKDGAEPQIRINDTEILLGATATQYVALANLVQTALNDIRSFINTHTHPAPGGATSAPLPLMGALGPVAATVVKAK